MSDNFGFLPRDVLELYRDELGSFFPNDTNRILDEPRFIRVALFDTPDSPRSYNGLAALLAGNDMYGWFLNLKTLEATKSTAEFIKKYPVLSASEWEWNGGEDLTGELLEEAKKLYRDVVAAKQKEVDAREDKREEIENA